MSLDALEALIRDWGYYAVLAGSLLEGETVLALAGYAAHLGYLRFDLLVAVAAFGAFVGDQFWFQVGRRAGVGALERLPGARLALPRFEALAARFPALVVILLRFLYGLRIAGPVALGAGSMRGARFAALNALGAVVWALLIGGAGWALGGAVRLFLDDAARYERWMLVAIAVAGTVFALGRWLRRRDAQARAYDRRPEPPRDPLP